jgi:DoxX-like family
MTGAYLAVTIGYSIFLALSAAVYLLRLRRIVATLRRLGLPASSAPVLGALKALGAFGLLLGIAVPAVGVAAAIGLVLYFTGAVVAHTRARAFAAADGFPLAIAFLLAAVAALALRVAAPW